MNRLRISEIFFSLQGETRTVGLPTVFIRLTGCPLRCQYCDTQYAFHGGKGMTIDDILQEVSRYHPRYVTVTGGEPLAQKPCIELLQRLCDSSYEVSLETSGALNIAKVDPRVVKIVDMKTPGSKECEKNLYSNCEYLLPHDQVKFVICNREDYDWSKMILQQYLLTNRCEVLFSPSYKEQSPGDLADWIIKDNLPVRMQIQLHKYLWGDIPGK